jgi:hypothetical protein
MLEARWTSSKKHLEAAPRPTIEGRQLRSGRRPFRSLRTATPEEGFALALRLSRMGVTSTQPDREVLHALRPDYAHNAEALIAASHVVAVHFQTIAAANNYWRE